jgi:hypothetical protein
VFSASPMPTSKRQTGTTVDRIYDEATTGWGPSEAWEEDGAIACEGSQGYITGPLARS